MALAASQQCYVFFVLASWKETAWDAVTITFEWVWNCPVLSNFIFQRWMLSFQRNSCFCQWLCVDVRNMLLQLIRIHGSIGEGVKTNGTLEQLLITPLYEIESIVEKSIVISSLSFSHSFLCNWKFNLTKYSNLCSSLTLTIHSAILAHTV